eukprot:SAG22_NODE_6612_length_831_cov_7.531421_1_plen_139_part_01
MGSPWFHVVAGLAGLTAPAAPACARCGGDYTDAGSAGGSSIHITQPPQQCTITAVDGQQPWSPGSGTVAGSKVTIDFGGPGGPGSLTAQRDPGSGDLTWSTGAVWRKKGPLPPPGPAPPAPGPVPPPGPPPPDRCRHRV